MKTDRPRAPLVPSDLVFGNVLVLLIFALGAWLLFTPSHASALDVAKTLGIAVAVASGILSPMNAIVMARYQSSLTAELEALKSDMNSDVERLKHSLSANLEIRKTVLAGQVAAFNALLNAANFFYFVIRQLLSGGEQDKLNDLVAEADKRAAEASAYVWHLSKEDRQKWYNVYQRSTYISKMLVRSRERPAEKLDKQAVLLGEDLKSLEAAGRAVFQAVNELEKELA